MNLFEVRKPNGSWIGFEHPLWSPYWGESLYDRLEGLEKQIFTKICEELPCAREYMLAHASEFGWEDSMIHRAKVFSPNKRLRPSRFPRPFWHCYQNSVALAKEKGYRYVEGLAICPTGPQIHAWCSTDGVDVIDVTWPYQEVNRYFGIEFDLAKMQSHGYVFGGMLGYMWDNAKKSIKTQLRI